MLLLKVVVAVLLPTCLAQPSLIEETVPELQYSQSGAVQQVCAVMYGKIRTQLFSFMVIAGHYTVIQSHTITSHPNR